MAEELEFEPIGVAPPDARIAAAMEAIALAQVAQLKEIKKIRAAVDKLAKKK